MRVERLLEKEKRLDRKILMGMLITKLKVGIENFFADFNFFLDLIPSPKKKNKLYDNNPKTIPFWACILIQIDFHTWLEINYFTNSPNFIALFLSTILGLNQMEN